MKWRVGELKMGTRGKGMRVRKEGNTKATNQ